MAYDPPRRNKYRITRAYNRAASEEDKKGFQEYGSTRGDCLNEQEASVVAANYDRADLDYRITIRQKVRYDRYLGSTVQPDQEKILYARPPENTVPSAMAALAEKKEQFKNGGGSSTRNEITEEDPICIRIHLRGRKAGKNKKRSEAPDYQERMAWLIQHYGSKNAVERETGIPRRTQTRILQGRLER